MEDTKLLLKYGFNCMQTLKQWNTLNLLLLLVTLAITTVTLLNINTVYSTHNLILKQNTEILKLLKSREVGASLTYVKDIPNITLTKEQQALIND